MPDTLILEFSAPGAVDLYNRVNTALGLDPASGSGDWPSGLLDHVGSGDGDALVVVETWQSKADQERFMHERLEPAFRETGIPAPTRVMWLPQVGNWRRG